MDPFKLGHLEDRGGVLYFEGVSTLKLAEEFGTPLYLVSQSRIEENYRRLNRALSKRYGKVRIYYSAKANSNLSVLRILAREGAWLDAVSPGEIFLGLKAGFPPNKILFTGTSVGEEELRYALASGATVNVDSLSQMRLLLKLGVPDVLSVRINPGVGFGHHKYCVTGGEESKFGLWKEEAKQVYRKAKEAGAKTFGIHMHVGSGILNVDLLLQAAETFLNLAGEIARECGLKFDFVDFGGGLGVPYKPEENELDVEGYAESMVSLFKRKLEEFNLGEPAFSIEPGRYIVCDSSILLTRVNSIKTGRSRKFIGVDAGLNALIRPAMYGAYHHVLAANKLREECGETCDVVGPICESSDFLAKGARLPKLEEGDLLAILNAGAYGFSMSSQYNARPRPAEVLVHKGRYEVIRERETLESLTVGQRIASWLA